MDVESTYPPTFFQTVHYPTRTCSGCVSEAVEIDELMRRADVVARLAPNISAYHHLIDARRLALLRDGRFLSTRAAARWSTKGRC